MINDKALLVNLEISTWTGRKFDKDATDTVVEEYQAGDNDCGRFNKALIDKKLVNEIVKLDQRARNFLYEQTVPWDNSGTRMLPTVNYFKFVDGINKIKTEREEVVSAFLMNYNDEVEKSKERLGGLWKANDYPSVNRLSDKFRFHIGFYPIPTTDFRVSLNDTEVEQIKENMRKELEEVQQTASKNLWQRMHKATSRIVERLSDSDKVFKKNLFENVEELYGIVKSLNVYDDPKIDSMIERMKTELLKYDPDTIRENNTVRSEVAKQADEILSTINDFI